MPRPLLQALLVADHVYQDKDTGKKVIAGTFNSLSISKAKVPPKEAEPGASARARRSRPRTPHRSGVGPRYRGCWGGYAGGY